MSYSQTIQEQAGYLHIEATGTRSRAPVVALTRDCLRACKEHGARRVLVDVKRMDGRLDTLDAYGLARDHLPRLREGLPLKVAITDLQENRTRFQFLEDVAVNAGVSLRVFSATDAALKWLLAGESPRPPA